MIKYRSDNLGMLELDLVVSKYVTRHIDQWTDDQCSQFYSQVLSKETPDLYKLIISQEMYLE